MAIRTPGYEKQHEALAALSSRYVTVGDIPWQETKFKGIWIKVLMEDSRHRTSNRFNEDGTWISVDRPSACCS